MSTQQQPLTRRGTPAPTFTQRQGPAAPAGKRHVSSRSAALGGCCGSQLCLSRFCAVGTRHLTQSLSQSGAYRCRDAGAQPLSLLVGHHVIPHPDKAATGGEDAFFVTDNGSSLGETLQEHAVIARAARVPPSPAHRVLSYCRRGRRGRQLGRGQGRCRSICSPFDEACPGTAAAPGPAIHDTEQAL